MTKDLHKTLEKLSKKNKYGIRIKKEFDFEKVEIFRIRDNCLTVVGVLLGTQECLIHTYNYIIITEMFIDASDNNKRFNKFVFIDSKFEEITIYHHVSPYIMPTIETKI